MPRKNKSSNQGSNKALKVIGLLLIGISLLYLLFTFFPVFGEELRYLLIRNNYKDKKISVGSPKVGNDPIAGANEIVPADSSFSIIVPKIGANAKVIPNVDPNDSREYQIALTHGVAHANGTALPGSEGNVFLFAHSSDPLFNANKYDSVFYLLHHMSVGDFFYIVYQDKKITYEVTEVKTVAPADLKYMAQPKGEKIATLMTCWPPGTTINRLVVVARQTNL